MNVSYRVTGAAIHAMFALAQTAAEANISSGIRVYCTGYHEDLMREWIFDLDRIEPYEAGARMIALLVHPGENEGVAQERTFLALCSHVLRLQAAIDARWMWTTQPIKPAYAFVLEQDISKVVKTVDRQLRDRMIAGQMAIPFIMESSNGAVPALLPGPGRPLSINRAVAHVCHYNDMPNAENVETRIWRPSVPVIHLSAAIEYFGKGCNVQGRRSFHWFDLMTSRLVIARVIELAEEFEGLVARNRRLRISSDRLVRLRLVGVDPVRPDTRRVETGR